MRNLLTFKNFDFTDVKLFWFVIIIIILLIFLPTELNKRLDRNSNNHRTKADIATLENILETYHIHNGHYPSNEQGLNSLVVKPVLAPKPKNWKGPYIRKIPLDYWNRSYKYKYPGIHNKNKFDLWSYGKDGLDETNDDISNWENMDNSVTNDKKK